MQNETTSQKQKQDGEGGQEDTCLAGDVVSFPGLPVLRCEKMHWNKENKKRLEEVGGSWSFRD